MYLNLFTYHIQDREYSKQEVYNFINTPALFSYNSPLSMDYSHSGHIALSNGNPFYSAGTFAEYTVSLLTKAHFAFSALWCGLTKITPTIFGTADKFEFWTDLGHVSSHILGATISNVVKHDRIVTMDDLDWHYSGRELTKFFNEYYDYTTENFRGSPESEKILKDFINHKYLDAEVPTAANNAFFSGNHSVLVEKAPYSKYLELNTTFSNEAESLDIHHDYGV